MKENKPVWLGESVSQAGVIQKRIEYYEGHVPKSKFPHGAKVIYGNGLTGHETEVHTQSITPVVTITVCKLPPAKACGISRLFF